MDAPEHSELPGVDPHPPPGLVLDAPAEAGWVGPAAWAGGPGTPEGSVALGPAVVDSDADGHPDTAVTAGPAGEITLATDLDADAHADVLTTVDPGGTARTVARGPDGLWSPPPGPPPPPSWDEGVPPPAPTLDPTTGRWTRSP